MDALSGSLHELDMLLRILEEGQDGWRLGKDDR